VVRCVAGQAAALASQLVGASRVWLTSPAATIFSQSFSPRSGLSSNTL